MTAALALAAPAQADPQVSVTVDPSALTFPGAAPVTYRVAIATGGAAERFSVELVPQTLPDGGAGLGSAGQPALDGPGEILGGSVGVATPACSPTQNRFHGYEPQTAAVDLALPAGATTALVARYAAGAFTPWPGANIGIAVRLRRRLSDGTRGTLSRPGWSVPAPRPALDLERSGVRVRLSTTPRSDPTAGVRRAARIRRGRRIAVRGSTRPRLANVRIRLAVVRPGSPLLRTLVRVRTDRRGRFRYAKWRPRRLGRYELWAFYRRQRADTVSDHRCPRGLRLVAP